MPGGATAGLSRRRFFKEAAAGSSVAGLSRPTRRADLACGRSPHTVTDFRPSSVCGIELEKFDLKKDGLISTGGVYRACRTHLDAPIHFEKRHHRRRSAATLWCPCGDDVAAKAAQCDF
jgi:hypothetical protein